MDQKFKLGDYGYMKVYEPVGQNEPEFSIVFNCEKVDKELTQKVVQVMKRKIKQSHPNHSDNDKVYVRGIAFAEEVKTIGDNSFNGLNMEIDRVQINSGRLETIGNEAFNDVSLSDVSLDFREKSFEKVYKNKPSLLQNPNVGLKNIGSKAFANNNLTSVDLPMSIKNVSLDSFEKNRKLKSVNFDQPRDKNQNQAIPKIMESFSKRYKGVNILSKKKANDKPIMEKSNKIKR